MRIASLVMLVVSGMLTAIGMFPCLVCFQWIAIPMSTATVVIGLVGLATDRDEKTRSDAQLAHLAAVVGGMLLVGFGMVRCLFGAGVI